MYKAVLALAAMAVAALVIAIGGTTAAFAQSNSRNVIINNGATPAERAAIIRGAARRSGENAYRQQVQQENMRSRPANQGSPRSGTMVTPNR